MKKIVTNVLILTLLLFSVACTSQEVLNVQKALTIPEEKLNSLKKITDNMSDVVPVTNETVINKIIKNSKWKVVKIDNDTKYVQVTGKYIDVKQAEKYAYLPPLYIMKLANKVNGGDNQSTVDNNQLIQIKETVAIYLTFANTDKAVFMFTMDGKLIEMKDQSTIFNSLVFGGYVIELSGIGKTLNILTVDKL